MDMTSMKLPPREEKTSEACCVEPMREDYPYGLRIHLDKVQLEQLGITTLPKPGAQVSLLAVGKVVNVSESANEHDKEGYRSVGIQITELGLHASKAASKKTEDVFYGGSEEKA